MKINNIITAAALLFSTASIASAQAQRGSIYGTVTDADGAAASDVETTLTVTDTETGATANANLVKVLDGCGCQVQMNRDPNTGEIAESLKIKRRTDDASVELVKAFLDSEEVDVVLPCGRNLVIFITAYSPTNHDGVEEFAAAVVESSHQPVEKHLSDSDGGDADRSVTVPAEYATRTYKKLLNP